MHSCRRNSPALLALAAVASFAPCGCGDEPQVQVPRTPAPGAAADLTAPDRFHPGFDPARDALPPPQRGGRVVVHIENLPRSLNQFLDNSGVTRRIHNEIHERLLERNFATTELEGVLAESWVVEDTLVLRDGSRLYGRAEQRGDTWHVEPVSTPAPLLDAARDVSASEVERVERGTVFTFRLRPGVKWHDGHPLRVEDFLLTWRLAKNPLVHCDQQRFQFDPIWRAEKLDERSLRFFYEHQYFIAAIAFEALIPLPAHLYDLHDPTNPDYDPDATDEQVARYTNEHRCNREAWVGLGPYRVTAINNEYVEAVRFEDYFDPEHAGWFDAIRWRFVGDDALAFRALLDGELDFTARVMAEDYFGAAATDERFLAHDYRGYYYTPRMTYLAWNTARPKLSDARVRSALAMSFDWDELIRSFYSGLAERVTAEWYDGGPEYDATLEPLPFDLERAKRLLAEAGWYDRDGDGWVDRDGAALAIELLLLPSKPSEAMAQRFQENLAKVGVKLGIAALDWSALNEKVERREFDAVYKAWIMPIESDPEQRWHSRQVGLDSGNETSYSDPEVDRVIEAIQRELDRPRRGALFRELQRKLYAAQAYMYGVKVPVKFAASQRIRNLRISPIDPGYRIRDWYFAEIPGQGR